MPYKLSEDKKAVMVQKGGKWVVLKRHATQKQARAHLFALRQSKPKK